MEINIKIEWDGPYNLSDIGYIEKEDIQTLNEWRKDPAHWDAGK